MRKILLSLYIILSSFSAVASVSFHDLDQALNDGSYQESKEQAIASKKAQARAAEASSDDDLYFWKLSEIRDEYAFYQIDSAMAYSLKSLEVAKKIERLDYLTIAQMHVVEEYIHQGMYIEAKNLLDGLHSSDIPESVKESYYYQYNALYEALGDYTENLDLKFEYRKKEYAYKDSVITVSPDNVFILSALLSASKQNERVLQVLMDNFNSLDADDRNIGPIAYAISLYYKGNGMRQEEKKYLLISAESDAKCCVKEYLSLRRLSEILYEEGEYSRAHRYIVRCMDDAMASGSRLRVVQISKILPILENGYQKKLSSQLMIVSISGAIILLLLVFLAILLNQLHHQKIKIDKANRILSEAGAIKNVYIFNLLMEGVKRIDTLDRYRKQIKRKALENDRAELLRDLKSTDIIDEQWRLFYQSFDSTFLEIFPTFIEEVNKMMIPGNEFEVGTTLGAELRILALIRLGVEETDRIASVLNYSRSTVYSYRSRIRLRARNPKLFEQDVKEIRSI